MFNLVGYLGSPDMAEQIRKEDYFLTGGISQDPREETQCRNR